MLHSFTTSQDTMISSFAPAISVMQGTELEGLAPRHNEILQSIRALQEQGLTLCGILTIRGLNTYYSVNRIYL